MPCRDSYEPSTSIQYVTRTEFDKVTRVACKLNNALERLWDDYAGYDDKYIDTLLEDNYIDPEVYNWIVDHRKKDEMRKEQLKASALSKLTPEEREALGL